MIGGASDRAIRLAGAAIGVGIPEGPFHIQIGIERGHEILLGSQERCVGVGAIRTPVRIVAIISKVRAAVVVVLEHHGVGVAMRVDGRGVVPAKVEGVQEVSISAEVQHMSLRKIVKSVSAEKDAAVRSYGGGGGRIIDRKSVV